MGADEDFASRPPHATTCSLDPDITQGAMNRNAVACMIQSSQGTRPVSLSLSLSLSALISLLILEEGAENKQIRQGPTAKGRFPFFSKQNLKD
jgi:hypothetical protein